MELTNITFLKQKQENNMKKKTAVISSLKKVTRLGLEPRLFCTKNRRVASYTIGHCMKNTFAKILLNQFKQNFLA